MNLPTYMQESAGHDTPWRATKSPSKPLPTSADPPLRSIRLLLIDDDEDYFVLTRDILSESDYTFFDIEWVPSYEAGQAAIAERRHDAYLIDYQLGARSGLELLEEILHSGCETPVIMLTGQGDRSIDLRAMQTGAADYLVKDQVNDRVLERSIRYAIRRASILRDMSRLVAILEATTDLVGTTDANGRFTYINGAGRKMLGFQEDENIVGIPLTDVHTQWAANILRGEAIPTANVQGSWTGETALFTRGGKEMPVSQQVLVHRDSSGEVEYYSTIARDITHQLAATEEESRLATAIQQVADCIIMTDTQGIIEYVNPAFEELTGYTREEVAGKSTRILNSGVQAPDTYAELWDTIKSGKVWTGRLINRKKDASTYEVDATITPVKDRSEKIINYVSTQRDVTYEQEVEEQIRQAQKMEAVGQLAGGIAHDFNNLLTVISGYSTLVAESIPDGDTEVLTHIDEIMGASTRAAELTEQLLAYGRRQIMQPQVINLNKLVAGIQQMLEKLLGEHTEFRSVLAEDLRPVMADPGKLEQVLMNMVINAHHAMPNGGTLSIESYNFEIDDSLVSQSGILKPGNYVVLAITDTGVGMTEEVKARLFEPFFTTRKKDNGTGLGLATCIGIVKQSGGDISVYSELDIGTTFRVYLPAEDANTPVALVQPAVPETEPGNENVLLVEDEGALRELMASVLTCSGYNVLTAINGEDGLRIAQESDEPIHIVITDVVMPKMGGAEMINEMKRKGLSTKTLFVSGYTDDALQHRGILDPDIDFLAKPFAPPTLTRKVRLILDR